MKTLQKILLSFVLVLFVPGLALAVPDCPNGKPIKIVNSFDFLIDDSGSMMMKHEKLGKEKVLIAADALKVLNDEIPELDYYAGLHTLAPYEEILAQSIYNKNTMSMALSKITADKEIFGRLTPLGDGLRTFAPIAQAMPSPAALFIATDGDNNRGISPVDEIRQLYSVDNNIVVHIISLADSEKGKKIIDEIIALHPKAIKIDAAALLAEPAEAEKIAKQVFYTCDQEEQVISLGSVTFAFDSYALDHDARTILTEAVHILKDIKGKIVVAGWTDFVGTDAYNMVLSRERAQSVANFLSQHGIDSNRLIVRGFGKSYKYDNEDPTTRGLNRRVELSIEE